MSGTVTIRLYGELAGLASAAGVHPRGEIARSFDVAPTAKDAIEALGVPHTEIDLLLADGEPVGLDHRLVDGERLAVYPTFRTIDVSAVSAARPPPLREVRFVADGHVAALARRLRILGFDVVAEADPTDDELAETSASEERVLLTRDRGLLKRRAVVHGFYVRDDDPDTQLLDVVRRYRLAAGMRPFSRCPTCNGLLQDVRRSEVLGQVETGTAATHDRFRRCVDCGQVYWAGAHHDRLRALVERARGTV